MMSRFNFDFDRIFKGKPKVSEKANNDCLLRGRITRPPIPLTDPAFQYTPACSTDAESIRRKYEQINGQK